MREIDMPGKYNPSAVEAGRYDKWVQRNDLNHQRIRKPVLIQSLFHHQMLLVSCI